MNAERDSSTVLTGDPPRVFDNVGVLLWPDLWFEWLQEHPGHADLLASGHGSLVELSLHTGWEGEKVLDRLGCDTKSPAALKKFSEDDMLSCTCYFRWVQSLLSNLDLESDKRLAVSGAARFFAAAEKDLPLCETIMVAGSFPPVEYLKLGEIAQSWQCAIRALDSPRGERARRTEDDNPFVDESSPHLSPKRLEMLNRPDSRRLLGPNVEANIKEHLVRCGVCDEAQARRRTSEQRRSVGRTLSTA